MAAQKHEFYKYKVKNNNNILKEVQIFNIVWFYISIVINVFRFCFRVITAPVETMSAALFVLFVGVALSEFFAVLFPISKSVFMNKSA